MIISASRRTDIPSYYGDWFFNRIKDGYVLVRNPINLHQVSRVSLSPDVVDCVVFWTKNPLPILDRLDILKNYTFYFQFTLTSYGKDIETNVPCKNKYMLEAFKRLSDIIGRERVIWRYDPVLLNEKYTLEYHTRYFDWLAHNLKDYTEKCVFSFIDDYRNIRSSLSAAKCRPMDQEQKMKLSAMIAGVCSEYGLVAETCAEDINLDQLGISHGKCIDDKLIERIGGYPLTVTRDKNQRLACGCVSSIDIGCYNTCHNGCIYCYANHSESIKAGNAGLYDMDSPLLCGCLGDGDVVKDRVVKSLKNKQFTLF